MHNQPCQKLDFYKTLTFGRQYLLQYEWKLRDDYDGLCDKARLDLGLGLCSKLDLSLGLILGF